MESGQRPATQESLGEEAGVTLDCESMAKVELEEKVAKEEVTEGVKTGEIHRNGSHSGGCGGGGYED